MAHPSRRSFRTAVLLTGLGALLVAPGAPGVAAPQGAAAAVREAARPDVPAALAGWRHDRPAPGVDLYEGVLSGRPGADHWTVTLKAGGVQMLSADAAGELAGRLRTAGFSPLTERVEWPRGADVSGLIGVRVRVGEYADRERADALQKQLADAGFEAASEWSGGFGTADTGSTRVHVAVVDPRRFQGELDATYGEGVAGRETVTDMATAGGALLGVNAGFFVMEAKDGVPGAPAGVAARNGELQAAATNGRIAAVLRGGGAEVELRHLRTSSRVTVGGASEVVDGVNRLPGLVRNCGGTGGDAPTEQPRHDVTCADPDEITQFTDELGADTPAGPGVEAVLDADGRVTALRARGGAVPAGGSVLAGVGAGEEWLRAHAVPGAEATVRHRVTDENGRPVRLDRETDIVNGGPRLVRDGKVAVDFGADGTFHAANPDFGYAWGVKRNPRTALGVDARGRLLIVAAEGRQPGFSDGLGVVETAELMAALGAVSAMNLDGGGSTAMTLDGTLLTRPSDATGERAVGDALLLTR